MKKSSLIIIISLLILSSQVARAASWSNQGSKDSRQQSRVTLQNQKQDIRDQIISEREKLRSEWKAGTIEAADKLGELHAESLSKRSTFYYNRLTGILSRLDNAIKSAETQYGVDKLAKARSLYGQAKARLDSAKTLSDVAISAFKDVKGEKVADVRTALNAAREKAKKAWETYKETTKLMKDSAKELRTVIQANKPSPSPKPSKSPRASGDVKAVPDALRKNKPTLPTLPPTID